MPHFRWQRSHPWVFPHASGKYFSRYSPGSLPHFIQASVQTSLPKRRHPQPAHHIGPFILYPPTLTCFFFLNFPQRDTISHNYVVIHWLSSLRKRNLPEGSSPALALKTCGTNERIAASCICIAFQHGQSPGLGDCISYMLLMKQCGLVCLRPHH